MKRKVLKTFWILVLIAIMILPPLRAANAAGFNYYTSIWIYKYPDKMTYTVGESFDKTGMRIFGNRTKADGSTDKCEIGIGGLTFKPATFTKAGKIIKVTITLNCMAASGKMEIAKGALYGGIISAVFLLFALISFVKGRAKNTYDAVVIDKKSELERRHTNSDDDSYETKYTVVAQTDDGKKKKIVEWESSQILAYNYLNVGDRFRYHPEFNFPYELYDKSRAPYIACVSCGTKNPVAADRCQNPKCRLPLLK